MSLLERKRAINWYVAGWDLSTIAQHFDMAVEELKSYLRNAGAINIKND